jgi:hemin uptake protein HemP
MQKNVIQREVMFKNNKIESNVLFANSHEVTIIHNGQEYKLRLTSNGKLILTK